MTSLSEGHTLDDNMIRMETLTDDHDSLDGNMARVTTLLGVREPR